MKRKEFWIKEGTYIGEPFEEDPFYSTVLDDLDKLYSSGYSNNHTLIHVVDIDSFNRLLEEARALRNALELAFYSPNLDSKDFIGTVASERFDKFLKEEGEK